MGWALRSCTVGLTAALSAGCGNETTAPTDVAPSSTATTAASAAPPAKDRIVGAIRCGHLPAAPVGRSLLPVKLTAESAYSKSTSTITFVPARGAWICVNAAARTKDASIPPTTLEAKGRGLEWLPERQADPMKNGQAVLPGFSLVVPERWLEELRTVARKLREARGDEAAVDALCASLETLTPAYDAKDVELYMDAWLRGDPPDVAATRLSDIAVDDIVAYCRLAPDGG